MRKGKRAALLTGLLIPALFASALLCYTSAQVLQERRNRQLFAAIDTGDPKQVAAALGQGADVNARFQQEDTDTTLLGTVRRLWKRQGTHSEYEGDTVLIYALEKYTVHPQVGLAYRGQVFRLLINEGADVKATDLDGRTVLDLAEVYNDTEAIDLLVEAGAER